MSRARSRQRRLIGMVAGLLASTLLLLACQGAAPAQPAAPTAQPAAQAPAAAAPAKPACPDKAMVTTGAPTGAGYAFSATWAQVLQGLGIDGAVATSGGSTDNVVKVHTDQAEFGYSSLGPAMDGFNGTGWAQGTKHNNLRALFMMMPNFTQFMVLDNSPVKALEDLAGKDVQIGPARSSSDEAARAYFATLGITANLKNLGLPDSVQQVLDGKSAAAAITGGAGLADMREAETRAKVRFVPIPKATGDKVHAQVPWLVPMTMEKIYASQAGPIETLGTWVFMFASNKMADSCVAAVMENTFANWDKLVAADRNARLAGDPKQILQATIPLHAGVVQYLKKQGVQVPDKMIPPEYKP